MQIKSSLQLRQGRRPSDLLQWVPSQNLMERRASNLNQNCLFGCKPVIQRGKPHIWLIGESDPTSSPFPVLKAFSSVKANLLNPEHSQLFRQLSPRCSHQPQIFGCSLTCLSDQVCPPTPDGSDLFILKITCFYFLGHRKESSLESQLPVLVASPNIQLSCILNKQKENKRGEGHQSKTMGNNTSLKKKVIKRSHIILTPQC